MARRRKEDSPKNRQSKEARIQTDNELERSSKSGNKKITRGNLKIPKMPRLKPSEHNYGYEENAEALITQI